MVSDPKVRGTKPLADEVGGVNLTAGRVATDNVRLAYYLGLEGVWQGGAAWAYAVSLIVAGAALESGDAVERASSVVID